MKCVRVWCVAIVSVAVGLTACAGDNLVPRWDKPEILARQAGWVVGRAQTGPFLLAVAHSRPDLRSSRLTIFIEGDGLAYLGPRRISPDPTPTDPVALRLALRHRADNVAWLGRPCQFVPQDVQQPACDNNLWTDARYSPQVIAVLDAAIDRLKAEFSARDLVLAGYSGGGALAVLIAAYRPDVVGIITVGAPLNLAAWTQAEGLSPLSASLDPADMAARVALIPQVHFVGGDDGVVGGWPIRAYLALMPEGHRAEIRVIADFDHDCCWARDWERLIVAMGRRWPLE